MFLFLGRMLRISIHFSFEIHLFTIYFFKKVRTEQIIITGYIFGSKMATVKKGLKNSTEGGEMKGTDVKQLNNFMEVPIWRYLNSIKKWLNKETQ